MRCDDVSKWSHMAAELSKFGRNLEKCAWSVAVTKNVEVDQSVFICALIVIYFGLI